MTRANPLKSAFNAGEISPRMESRVDYAKYQNGCSALCNMTPLVQGGVMRRPGTRYVAEVKDSIVKPRLMRFEFSTEQAYVIEAGNNYFRFFMNQGRITAGDTTAAIANGTFDNDIGNWTDRSGAGSSIAHDATGNRMSLTSNGTTNAHAEQQVANASAIDHILRFRVFGAPGDKVKLRIGTTSTGTEIVNDVEFAVGTHAYTFTATAADFHVQFLHATAKTLGIDNVSLIDNAPLELSTPYATAELISLKTAQSADVMYIAHPDHPIYKLTRSAHTSWSLIEVPWQDGPYLDKNLTDTTFQAAAASGLAVTVTASATEGINDGAGFKSTDVGRALRIDDDSAEPGWGAIVTVTDTTHVDVDIKRDMVTTAEKGWSLGGWSSTTGHPATVGFFEQRFAVARTTKQPQTFWFSQSADIENMRPDSWDSDSSAISIDDDDALAYTIAAAEVNAILWMSAGRQFVLGTSAGPWVAESDGAILTPNDIQCRRQTTNGAADVTPARVDDVVLYVQRAKRKINEFAFNFESDGYQTPDMTILSDHITRSGVVEMAWQEEPHSVLWCVRDDGVLAAMTYRRGENVVDWCRHVLGGAFSTGNAAAESVVAIPGNATTGSDDRDETWVIVRRTIDGVTKRYVEFFEKDFEGPLRNDYSGDAPYRSDMLETQKNAFYVDCGLTLDNPVTISGATADDPVVITATGHGFSNNDVVEIAGVLGMTELNGNSYKVANKTADTFEITDLSDNDIDGSGFAAYVSGGKARKKVTSITGLDHLEGETVKILADGAVHPDKTVNSGTVTLDYAAARIQCGLGYTHTFKSLKLAAGAAAGTAIGKIKRVHKVGMVLMDSATARIGPHEDALQDVTFREVGDAMDTAVPLFSGEKMADFDADYERDQRIVIQNDAPAPFTLLALAPEMKTNEQA